MRGTRIFLFAAFASLIGAARVAANVNATCDWYRPKVKYDRPECFSNEDEHRVTCFFGIEGKLKSGSGNVTTLTLCEWREESFDPQDVLREFPSLRRFDIERSNLTKLTTSFPAESRLLEIVNFTSTGLRSLPDGALANLSSLRVLDLRNNALAEINPSAFDEASSLEQVYLSGNPLRCTEDAAWILDARNDSLARRIVDRDNLRCSAPYEGRPFLPVIEIITALREQCKETVCDCELVYVVARGGRQVQKQLMAFASVNCSHRGLMEMPAFLPDNTTTLRLTGNKIKDLAPLVSNPVYKSVLDLYLDDNLVESIVQLEGSDWLDRFRLLSLRRNKLTDLPTYALENVLLQSRNAASLYLGDNPWRCDCLFTPGFQDLLIRHPNIVKDVNDIRCSPSDHEKANKQVHHLTRTEICISPEEDAWLHPLDVLNVVLASLIFLVLGKLVYDYWCFKKTGRLPWIVAKIP